MWEIAGGIILAVIILSLLPLVFTKGFWIFVAIIALIFVIFVAAVIQDGKQREQQAAQELQKQQVLPTVKNCPSDFPLYQVSTNKCVDLSVCNITDDCKITPYTIPQIPPGALKF